MLQSPREQGSTTTRRRLISGSRSTPFVGGPAAERRRDRSVVITWAAAGALFCLIAACEQESGAVEPWVPSNDVPAATDIGDVADAEAEVLPPGAWQEIPLGIEFGEQIEDIWGYEQEGTNLLTFVTNAGRFGRLREGEIQGSGLEVAPPSPDVQLPFRAVFTTNGDTFWLVGHGGTVRSKGGLWSTVKQAEEIAGDWNDVWSDGSQAMWFVGADGAVLRSGYDGKEPIRTTIGADDWLAVTGSATQVYLISRKEILRLEVAVPFPEDGVSEPASERFSASEIGDDQVFKRLWLLDPARIFVVGSPASLLMSDGASPLALATLATEPSGLNDVHGTPSGDLLATGVGGFLGLYDGVELHSESTENLPEGFDLERVWSFADGSAYVVTTFDSRLFFRAPNK